MVIIISVSQLENYLFVIGHNLEVVHHFGSFLFFFVRNDMGSNLL